MCRLMESLGELAKLQGPPGFEDPVREFLRKAIEELPGTEFAIDGIGNLLVRIRGRSPSARKVLIDAHMDEPCFMVKYVDDNGFLYFVQLGYISETVIVGQPVIIHGRKGPIAGVFGVQSFHLSSPPELRDGLVSDDMWIDVGAESRESVYAMGIRSGSPATFASVVQPMGDGCMMGRAMDNRTGCAIGLELARALSGNPIEGDVFLSFSVQEELILRGSAPVIRGLERYFGATPDVAIALDISTAGDFPGVPQRKSPIALRKGPGIKVYDRSVKSHYSHVVPLRLVEEIERIASERGVPIQYDFLPGSTNADIFALEGSGILTGGISVPCRYTHSPVETVFLGDMQKALILVLAICEEAGGIFARASPERQPTKMGGYPKND